MAGAGFEADPSGPLEGAGVVVGAGESRIAELAPAGAVFAGAVTGAFGNAWSSTDLGARLREDASARRNDNPRKIPPHHQLALVSRFPVCRVPRKELAELLTPPNDAAMPPPCPDCIRIAMHRMILSMISRMSRKVYSIAAGSV